MSNYAWLCKYSSHYVTNTYGMVIQTDQFDGVELFFLEQKKCNTITSDEMETLEAIDKLETKFWQAWKNYEFIPQQEMPIKLFKKPDIDYNNMPNNDDVFFVITNGYLILSKKLHDIISQFNLGKTHFSQVYIYDIETKEQLSDVPYYFINIAEKRDYLDVKKSHGIVSNEYAPQEPLKYLAMPKDDGIQFFNTCFQNDVDIWHEPILYQSLFFSDRLVNALLDAGFTKEQLGLIRCVIQ